VIYLDDVLEAYMLESLMHAFSIWMGYTLGHVVGELIMLYIIDDSYLYL
jgi:hypothetical protein